MRPGNGPFVLVGTPLPPGGPRLTIFLLPSGMRSPRIPVVTRKFRRGRSGMEWATTLPMTPQGFNNRVAPKLTRTPACDLSPVVPTPPDGTRRLNEGCSPHCNPTAVEIADGYPHGSQVLPFGASPPSSSFPPIGSENTSPLGNSTAARKNILIVDDEVNI